MRFILKASGPFRAPPVRKERFTVPADWLFKGQPSFTPPPDEQTPPPAQYQQVAPPMQPNGTANPPVNDARLQQQRGQQKEMIRPFPQPIAPPPPPPPPAPIDPAMQQNNGAPEAGFQDDDIDPQGGTDADRGAEKPHYRA